MVLRESNLIEYQGSNPGPMHDLTAVLSLWPPNSSIKNQAGVTLPRTSQRRAADGPRTELELEHWARVLKAWDCLFF